MPRHHQFKQSSGARHPSRRACPPARHRNAGGASSAKQRAQIVARLIAASRELPAHPDAAALLLDGALSDLLAHWASDALPHKASGDEALRALDAQAPAIAGRLRLALQAHNPEARLVHCWALLDLLTTPSTTAQHGQDTTDNESHTLNAHQFQPRKDNPFHVS